MPPPNISFATAVDLGVLPANVVLNVHDGGTGLNYTVYYKFTAPVGARVIGAWGFSGNLGAGYRPVLRPYLGPAGAPTQILGIGSRENVPVQFPVVAGQEYFLELNKNAIDTAPAVLTLN